VTVRSVSRMLSPIVLALATGIGAHVLASQASVAADPPASWYRVTVPAAQTQSTVADGVRFVRTAADGADVVMQLRAPVAAVFTPAQVVERLQAAIEAADGLHDAIGTPTTTQTANGISQAYLSLASDG
jgi:hypothetical protein